jgi:general secretion pathway protein J
MIWDPSALDGAHHDGDHHGEAGFTLVELLVALSLLSLVATALFASLRLGIVAWGRSIAHVEGAEHITFAQNFLRRSIADAYPLFSLTGVNRGQVAFEGTATSLKLLAPSPMVLGGGGRSWLTLLLDQHDQRTDLVMITQLELADAQAAPQLKRPLITNVQRVVFGYYGRSRGERTAQWRGQWMREATLPELVRIRVEYPQGDARVWPELVVKPRIAVDVGCAYEPLTKACRGR